MAPDEGITKFAAELGIALRHVADLTLIATRGESRQPDLHVVGRSRTFINYELWRVLRARRPEVVFYVPSASTTFMAFVRSRILRAYCPQARVVLIGLQPRRHAEGQKRLLRYLAPHLVLVGSAASQRYLAQLGCPAEVVGAGVDLARFHPVADERRRELRAQYGLAPDLPVVLHVGHLKAARGIRALAVLALSGACQAVLVTSTSTHQDAALAAELSGAGVKVLSDYIARIEHLYQLADCYVFPVESVMDATEVPLSVLEACGCDLPVVTTRFGDLPRMFGERSAPGLVFVETGTELVREALRWSRAGLLGAGTRSLVLRHSWSAIATGLLSRALADGRGGPSECP